MVIFVTSPRLIILSSDLYINLAISGALIIDFAREIGELNIPIARPHP